MTKKTCNVVYVHQVASQQDDCTQRGFEFSGKAPSTSNQSPSAPSTGSNVLNSNLELLQQIFNKVYFCTSGKSCILKLSELNKKSNVELIPTIVLINVSNDKNRVYPKSRHKKYSSTHSSSFETVEPSGKDSTQDETAMNDDECSLALLQRISLDVKCNTLSKLFVPIAMVDIFDSYGKETSLKSNSKFSFQACQNLEQQKDQKVFLDNAYMMQCIDIGAVDILLSPISEERLLGLMTHAYRAYKNALTDKSVNLVGLNKGRKVSWVGLDEQKPYAYLREAMVSGLMDGICQVPHYGPPPSLPSISLCPKRKKAIPAAVGSWDFSAHEFTDDELLYSALLILQHTLAMSELEPWRISTENLTAFLLASRSAYNTFVPYHNFRHVVDVLQACFIFLVRLGRIPPYPEPNSEFPSYPSALAESIQPCDALTLLITAIGHDVGHPGVNNAFLVTLNAPLAQLYNDRSVLESFHCAAYSQILRRHWPAAFKDVRMRKLMINSILATDMGLHFDYMKKMARVPEKLSSEAKLNGFKVWSIEEQKTLACSLLIKCADISNAARKHDIASRWTMILTDEFARQAVMEKELGIPSSLFAPPVREIIELGKSQIDFMEKFACPLFEGISDIMPAMRFCVEELYRNKSIWQEKISKKLTEKADSKSLEENYLNSYIFGLNQGNESVDLDSQDLSKLSDRRLSHSRSSEHIRFDLNTDNRQEYCSPTDSKLKPLDIPNLRDTSPQSSSSDCLVGCRLYGDSSRNIYPASIVSNYIDISTDLTENHDERLLLTRESLTARKTNVTFGRLEKGRRSYGTEISSSSTTGDWTSQDFSDNLPRSPSTKGSSVTLDSQLSNEEKITNTDHGPIPASVQRKWDEEQSFPNKTRDIEQIDHSMKCFLVVQKLRVLHKKPSRFRMNFWKKNKKDELSPILFNNVDNSDDGEASSWGCGLGSHDIAYRTIVKDKIFPKT